MSWPQWASDLSLPGGPSDAGSGVSFVNSKRRSTIDELGIGDVLVLAEWDRFARSMIDGIARQGLSRLGLPFGAAL
jgi:hypothetical protein